MTKVFFRLLKILGLVVLGIAEVTVLVSAFNFIIKGMIQ